MAVSPSRKAVLALAWVLIWAGVGCDDPRVSHVRVEDLAPSELDGLGRALSEGVLVDGERIHRPAGGQLREGEEVPLMSSPGDGRTLEEPGRRSPAFRPDRVTELEGEVGYYAVFTPSIAPFKRMSALDAVVMLDGAPALGVSRASLQQVPVEGPEIPPPDGRPRDRFWGSVVLDFTEGRTVPLPSVSPESRILELHTDPEVPLTVARDGADNFYVTAPPLPPEQVRVTFMTDAPRNYFGAPLPDVPSDTLAHELFPLPPDAARDATEVASELGLWRGMPMDQALETLARHFRSFTESREPPEDTGSIYLDLARAKRGVCRHRAYAFVITAQALGIVARFVQNEAHAWVEVEVPERGFLRLDLGGAPHGLVAHGTGDRPTYAAHVPDPWPRPEEYVEAQQQALAQGQALDAPAAAGASGRLEAGGTDRATGDTALKPTLASGRSRSAAPPPRDEREPVRLNLSGYESEVLRGQQLHISGRADSLHGAEPIEGLRIEVSLASRERAEAVLLGVAVTDERGVFEGSFAVPPDLAPDDYALVVVTPGDATYAAARAP